MKNDNGFVLSEKKKEELFRGNVWAAAHSLASHYHFGQKYGEEKYTSHLAQVSWKSSSMAKDTAFHEADLHCVAWLHDILEDTHCTVDEILSVGISEAVVAAVVAITKLDGEARIQYLDRVKENPLALHVKIADTLCNMEASIISGNKRLIEKYTSQINYLTGVSIVI